jgi:hypothetical protein
MAKLKILDCCLSRFNDCRKSPGVVIESCIYTGNNLWDNSANWDLGGVPQPDSTPADAVRIEYEHPPMEGPIIQDGMNVGCGLLTLGVWGPFTSWAELTVTGGALDINGWFALGDKTDGKGLMTCFYVPNSGFAVPL